MSNKSSGVRLQNPVMNAMKEVIECKSSEFGTKLQQECGQIAVGCLKRWSVKEAETL